MLRQFVFCCQLKLFEQIVSFLESLKTKLTIESIDLVNQIVKFFWFCLANDDPTQSQGSVAF